MRWVQFFVEFKLWLVWIREVFNLASVNSYLCLGTVNSYLLALLLHYLPPRLNLHSTATPGARRSRAGPVASGALDLPQPRDSMEKPLAPGASVARSKPVLLVLIPNNCRGSSFVVKARTADHYLPANTVHILRWWAPLCSPLALLFRFPYFSATLGHQDAIE